MIDKKFAQEYIEKRKKTYEEGGLVFAKKNGRAVAMLKGDWSNFETEITAWSYHENYLSEVLVENLCLPGGDLTDKAYYSEAVAAMAEYLRADELEWSLSKSFEEMSTPFSIVLKTFFEAISYEEIARTFMSEYRKTNPLMEATRAWGDEQLMEENAARKAARKGRIRSLFGEQE